MKRNVQMAAVLAAIAASFLVGCNTEKITDRTDPTQPSIALVSQGYDTFGRRWGETNQPAMITRSNAVLLTYTGTITDIDYTTREVTLKDSDGKTQTFVVDKSVQRLNEAKVGDKVSVDYYLGYNAEVRKPTAAEEQNPLVVVETAGKTAAGETPAAGTVRTIRAVVTIEDLNRVNQTVTVRGPRGKYFTARVLDPSRLEQVHIGDTIVMTFTEALAIALRPAT
jgi:hypothetical protein